MIDRDIHMASALLVDGNAMMRSVAVGQLKDLGVGNVTQASRVKDARMLLEQERFDIVICNREFEAKGESGQDLLDELRRENLLPYSTVFLMVTASVTYSQVVEAGEAALDGVLVRPYTTGALSERLADARLRKKALGDIFKALDAGEVEVAFARALKRFQDKLPFGSYCGRLAAELLMRLNRPDDARKMFDFLAQTKGAPWARLGAARAQLAAGDVAGARKVVNAVLAEHPDTADAQDMLGRMLVDQCDFDGALAAYRAAAELTPGCLLRTQHAGTLAFYQSQADTARALFERAMGLGVKSKLFDALTLVLMAMLRFDRSDAAGVASIRQQLARSREGQMDSARLLRFEQAANVLEALGGQAPAGALPLLRELGATVGLDDADLETANVVLALWQRVPAALRPAGEFERLAEQIGMRFCVSKASAEVLMASVGRSEPATSIIKRCQAQVAAASEDAMSKSMQGDAAGAVQQLLDAGTRARNARLLEMAGSIARRHKAHLADSAALSERAGELLKRHCSAVNHIAGIQRAGRAAGGMQLRA